MKNKLSLHELPQANFNSICIQLGFKPSQEALSKYRDGAPRKNVYFTLEEHYTYKNAQELLEAFDDPMHPPANVWMPGSMKILESRYKIKNDPASYFDWLKENEHNYTSMLVELEGDTFSGKLVNDTFRFRKESDLWVLRRLEILYRTFPLYDIEGVPKSTVDRAFLIYAIYPEKPKLPTPSK